MINHVYLRMIKLSHELIYKYDYFCNFINIENYHKSYFYKKLSSKFKIYNYDKFYVYIQMTKSTR